MQYALALALICGLLFFLAWLFRLGQLQNFLSRAVLIGFVSGLGVQVFTNQIRKILGVSIDIHKQLETLTDQVQASFGVTLKVQGYLLEVAALIRELPHSNLYTVAIGVGSLASVRLLKRFAPKVPGALVTLVVMTLVVAYWQLDERGVSVLGQLPAGLPAASLPTVPASDYVRLLPGALALVAITLCEGLLLVRSYSQKHGYKVSGDGVLFAYGMANVGAGLTGSMATGNSVSRSAAMDSAGARSQWTSLLAAGIVAVVLAFFTDLLAVLPNAALAGIVANAVLSLIAVGDLRNLYRVRRSEFWIAMVCLLAVLGLGPLRAVAIAFLLSIIDLLTRASRPYTAVLREAPGGDHFVADDSEEEPSAPGLVVYRFSAPLFFANAGLFQEEIQKLVSEASAPVKWLVLDADAMVEMDTTGAETLQQVIDWLDEREVTLAVSRAHRPFRLLLENYELLAKIGDDRLFATNRDAAMAFHEECG